MGKRKMAPMRAEKKSMVITLASPNKNGITAEDPQENLTQKGAMALAKRLEDYWHQRGFPAARFWTEPLGERFEKVGTYEIYKVMSNLINGLPPRYERRAM